MPTLGQFVERAQKYGCDLRATTIPTFGPRGRVKWRYLKKGEDRIAVLPDIKDDEYLTPTQLRSLIAELNLPPLKFWLTLG
jgi:hypothetical protein